MNGFLFNCVVDWFYFINVWINNIVNSDVYEFNEKLKIIFLLVIISRYYSLIEVL